MRRNPRGRGRSSIRLARGPGRLPHPPRHGEYDLSVSAVIPFHLARNISETTIPAAITSAAIQIQSE
jgi:hypothetical protein